jgi:hypothetical protein
MLWKRLSLKVSEALAPRYTPKFELRVRKPAAPAAAAPAAAAPAAPAAVSAAPQKIGPAERAKVAKSLAASIMAKVIAAEGERPRVVLNEIGSRVQEELVRIANRITEIELREGRSPTKEELAKIIE